MDCNGEREMPIKKCTVGGKPGKKYGDEGKCYAGKGGKGKAVKQMKAIKASQARAKK